MSAIILILQLGLLITSTFTVSSKSYASAVSEPDLECLNDYLEEMVCSLTSDQVVTCSEYSLNVSRYDSSELFTCDLKQRNSSACECLVHVKSGFVLSEIYSVKGKNLFNNKPKYVNTTESIKPKKPLRVSVKKTQNENFLIAWDTQYGMPGTKRHVFNSDLISELTYYVEGNEKSKKTVTVSPKGRFEYELVGKNLESNSNYIVIARIKSPLNQRFSDYSDPVGFTTPLSPNHYLKIIIPVICIILIISVFVIYYSCNKILTKWWDKIPTPKIATSFVKQVPNLLSFQNEFSPVHLDSSKFQSEDKIWLASTPVDIRYENSLKSLGKDSISTEVSYSPTVIQSFEENSSENKAHGKESQSTSTQLLKSTYYKNLKVINSNGEREFGNSSDFYKSCNTIPGHSNNSEITFPALEKNEMRKTDFEFSLWTRSSGSANVTPSLFSPPSSEITVVHGYESVSKLQDCASTQQAFISSCNDVNLITASICNKNAPEIPGNGYQDVQTLLWNSGKQRQTPINDPELKQLWGLDLHSSPGIEIDCSYQRV